MWDLVVGKLKYTFDVRYEEDLIPYLVFKLGPLPNGYMFSLLNDGSVNIWDITQGRLKHTFRESIPAQNAISLDDQNYLAVHYDDDDNGSEVKIWDLKNYQLKFVLDGFKPYVAQYIGMADLGNGLMVTGHSDIKIWNLNDGSLVQTLDIDEEEIENVMSIVRLDDNMFATLHAPGYAPGRVQTFSNEIN